jgi:hypothetical protein
MSRNKPKEVEELYNEDIKNLKKKLKKILSDGILPMFIEDRDNIVNWLYY